MINAFTYSYEKAVLNILSLFTHIITIANLSKKVHQNYY